VQPSGLAPDTSHPHAAIRFYDSSDSDWDLLDDATINHATRSFSQALEVGRLRDRYSQHSRDLFQLTGWVDEEALSVRDTVEYDGKDWVVTFEEQTVLQSKKRIILTELRDDSPPSDLVTVST